MGNVRLTIGGRGYDVRCADGEEDQLVRLAARVDAKVRAAQQGGGGINESRQLLFAALMLADEAGVPAEGDADGDDAVRVPAATLDALSARIESIARTLTQG